ncbi:CBS domain-containing protein [Cesiribacter andamanensis]|uniref:Inosine-5'-monophosphate dehydrogenase n=1 Tax=Cesiribacter andamanensis AMV16 TaxID=1279009 RepID=M7MXB2_9BACT|nr:CBS domain-containing protein [Cesiribacter andamanensis]EMR01073.1 Inosine-5'-monophosphate dehydrogenase [Cesiribacter andamanensis AMV16]
MNFTPAFIKTKEKLGDPVADVRYMPISKYMVRDVITLQENTPIREAIGVILRKDISGIPIVDKDDCLVGMLSEKDCLKVILDDGYYNNPLNDQTVGDYMTPNVYTLRPDTDILTAAKAFINSPFRRYPVVDERGRLLGQLSRKDLLKATQKLHTTTW